MAVPESSKKSADRPEPVAPASRFASTAGGSPQAGSTSLPLAGGKPLAGESSDPAVHKLLADRQALVMNRDALAPPVDEAAVAEVDRQLAQVDKQLTELGYAQK